MLPFAANCANFNASALPVIIMSLSFGFKSLKLQYTDYNCNCTSIIGNSSLWDRLVLELASSYPEDFLNQMKKYIDIVRQLNIM
jgi:hypothetical protein